MNKKEVDYTPLFQTLENRGVQLIELEKEYGWSPKVTSKFRKNENVSLSTLHDICEYLDVPIEKVVRINRGD
ncbi:helix-turn-helix domain-containing protein [Salibacterium lacus]|uniref:Helix-turn-helix domain-containing protein n=1 Tax=Salibacterium lacus TaxID=1898109 RepID=A0ABW5SY94_9BACI